jgi:predicted ATPase
MTITIPKSLIIKKITMLQRLYVHNYRCLENFELNLKDMPSALLIGKNGVGKSAIAFINKIVVITVYSYFF